MITHHNLTVEDGFSTRVGKVYVAICSCGWRSLPQYDAEQAAAYHAEHVATVTDPAVAALRALGWSDDQIVAALVAAARIDAIDNPPAHAVACRCLTCDAARTAN